MPGTLRRFRWLLAVVLAVLLVLATYPIWLTVLGGYLVHSDAPVPADMIVVLAGDFTGSRILTAGNLLRQGLAPKALISGPAGVYGIYESELAIALAVRNGYPAAYFVAFPNDSKSTASESEAVISELRKLHVHKIDLVTSNFHTRRAAKIFRSQAPDIEVHTVAAPDRYFTPNGWWKEREGRKTFVMEWMKTVGEWFGL
ncbi:MAG TPA: YdcF family protein [Bryobacteraceae bacterium]|nr:YdcF family protein [Bryobacteraceae bacterium]